MEIRTFNQGVRWGLLAGAVVTVVGCFQGRYEPILSTAAPAFAAKRWEFIPRDARYYGDQSAVWNFQNVLENSAYACGQQAEMGHILYRQLQEYGSSMRPDDNAEALADCQQHAHQRGNEAIARLKQAKVSNRALELSKELYSKWSFYLSGLTIYSSKNTLAATQYEASRRAVLAEDKFSQ